MGIRRIVHTPYSKAKKEWMGSKDFRVASDARSLGVAVKDLEYFANRLINAFTKGWNMRGESERGGRWIKGDTPPPSDAEGYLCTFYDHNSEDRYVAEFFWDREGWHRPHEESVIGIDTTILAYRPLPSAWRGVWDNPYPTEQPDEA